MGIQINGQTDTISSTDGSLNIGGTVTVQVTGDATGLTGTPDITVGAVTASSATISGDLTVNGTTTTLDTTLTEVDKLEVGANNTTVGVAITQSGTGDILRLYDSSTQVVTVADGGSVGIGTDNPGTNLDVAGNIRLSAADPNIQLNDGGPRLRVPTGNTLTIHTGGNLGTSDYERLRIDSSGNVGIGTDNASPGRLTVNNVDSASTPTLDLRAPQNGRIVRFKNNAGGDGSLFVDGASNTINYKFSTYNTTNAFYIKNDGNVGIGTDAPTSFGPTLQVAGTDPALLLQDTATAVDYFGVNVTSGITQLWYDDAAALTINTASGISGAGLAEKVRINSNGAIGIGTASPQQSNIPSIHLHTNTSDDARIAITTPTKPNSRIGYFGLSDKFGIDVHNGFEIRDASASYATRLSIDSSGNVTIPNIPLIKTNMNNVYGSAGSLTASPLPASAILQSSAEIDRGNNGWSTSGSNAYTFVCPVTGIYAVHAHMSLDDIAQGSRIIFTMAYTAGGGNLPLDSYVEVMDVNMDDWMNYSYYNTWNFTAGTRVGFGLNGVSGTVSGINSQWGIHLIA